MGVNAASSSTVQQKIYTRKPSASTPPHSSPPEPTKLDTHRLFEIMTNFQPQGPDTDSGTAETRSRQANEAASPRLDAQAPSRLPDPDRNLPVPIQSHVISTILTPALRLWLRSQAEQAEDLYLLIEGGDRQLLKGLVPRVTISAKNVLYKGLYLSRITLVGRGIKVNFGQILRRKPLRLERTIPVQAEVQLTQEDLNDSLQSPLLSIAIIDFLVDLLRAGAAPDLVDPSGKKAIVLDNLRAKIAPGVLTLRADLISATQGTATPFVLRTGLRAVNGRQLLLQNPEWLPTPNAKRGLALHDLDEFPLDLGSDVEIQELVLGDRVLTCRGKINVVPEG